MCLPWSVFDLPMSTITVIEDALMIVMRWNYDTRDDITNCTKSK
jgi:hypothetical protein